MPWTTRRFGCRYFLPARPAWTILFQTAAPGLAPLCDQAVGFDSAWITPFTAILRPRSLRLAAARTFPIFRPPLSARESTLQTTDVVLGPTEDGGYFLVGAKQPVPALFADIAWSTGSVLAQSRARAEQAGLVVGLLDPERDLDTFDDVQSFLREDAGAGKHTLSTRTGNVLHTLMQRHGNASPG